MSSSLDVHTPRPFELNGLWRFYPELAFQEGEPDPKPSGPFRVIGDYKIKEEGRPDQRYLLVRPSEGLTLPTYNTFAVEYPEKLIAGDCVTFERKRRAHRIRAELLPPPPGSAKWCQLHLHNHILPVREYVVYERQVEGTWIPVEADGNPLLP